MIFWEIHRRAAEMAANTPKKFTWMPGKTLLKSQKNLKRSGVCSGLCLPCENLGGAFGNGAAEQFPAGCFLTSSNILPALSDHAAQRSGKKHTPQKWVPGHLCLYCSCRCAANCQSTLVDRKPRNMSPGIPSRNMSPGTLLSPKSALMVDDTAVHTFTTWMPEQAVLRALPLR